MPTTNKSYSINIPQEKAYNTLSDLQQFGELHPLIVKVSKLDQTNYKSNQHRIKERPFLWLPLHFYYKAKVVLDQPSKIVYKVSGIPFLNPKITYTLSSLTKGRTKVDLTLNISDIPIVSSLLRQKMIAAQDHIFETIV